MLSLLQYRREVEGDYGWFFICGVLFIFWLLWAIVSASAASARGNSSVGAFFLGLFFGPIGFAMAVVAPKNMHVLEERLLFNKYYRRCQFCQEVIRSAAVRCKHCCANLYEEPEGGSSA